MNDAPLTKDDLLPLLRFRILDRRNCDMESMTSLMGKAADEIERLEQVRANYALMTAERNRWRDDCERLMSPEEPLSSNQCREAFDVWAHKLGLFLDELFMSSAPENPFEDQDTKSFYMAWLASWKACEALRTAQIETLLRNRDALEAELKKFVAHSIGPRGDEPPNTALALVRQQAEDDGLWFDSMTAPEAYLQSELRRLHAAIEGTVIPLTGPESRLEAQLAEIRPAIETGESR